MGKVMISFDAWCGANNNWNNSEDFIQSLRSKGINIVSDSCSVITISGKDAWIQAKDIGLTNVLAKEWGSLVKVLSNSPI